MAGATMKELSADVKTMGVNTSNIFQRMLKAQTLIKTVGKNSEIETGKRKYKAVTERDILDAVKDVEDKCGIYSYPFKRETYEVKTTKNSTGYESQWIRIETTYRFVNIDNPTDYIEVQTYGDGVDSMDKAPGKAMTYADKYALMKAYKISTGDDPDAEASEPQQKAEPPKSQKTMEELVAEWSSCRNKLLALGVDVHDEKIIQWIADKTGYPDQQTDFSDPNKMIKVNAAYKALIKAKEVNGHE